MLIEKIAEFQDLSDKEKLDACIKVVRDIWNAITSFFPLPEKERAPILTHEKVSSNPTSNNPKRVSKSQMEEYEEWIRERRSGLDWTYHEQMLPSEYYRRKGEIKRR